MLEEYYNELDPVKRKDILDAIVRDEIDEEERTQLNKLFEARYTKDKKRGYVDHFLGAILDLQLLAEDRNGAFVKKQDEKRFCKDLNVLCLDQPDEFPQEILYREMCHLIKTYIFSCQDDKNYNSVLFGMGRINHDTQTILIRKDLEKIVDVGERYPDKTEQFEVLVKAININKASLSY